MSTNQDDLLRRIRERRAQRDAARQPVLEVPHETPGRRSVLPGGLNTLAQGASFGFSDELIAGARALPRLARGGETFREAFSESVEAERAGIDEFRESHGGMALATELAGGLLSGIGTAAGLARAGYKPVLTLARGIATGAGAGAAGAFGAAEGNVLERLPSAATGTVVGAGLGLVAPAAGRVGGAVAEVTGLRGKLGRIPALFDTSRDRGLRSVLRDVEGQGNTLDDVRYALSPSQAGNKPVMLSDAIGGNAPMRVAHAASNANPEQATVTGRLRVRNEGSAARAREDLAAASGVSRGQASRTAQQVGETQRREAAPLYDKLKNIAIKDPDETFTTILNDPAFAEAYRRAARIAQREGYRVPDLYDEAGNFRGDQSIPVRVFDYLNRGLRDMRKSETGLGPDEWRTIQSQRAALLAHVDELVPEFRQARGVWAGHAGVLDAIDEGTEAAAGRADPLQIAERIAELTDGERRVYRMAMVDEYLRQMGEVADTHNASRRILGSEGARARILAAFGSEHEFDKLLAQADLEGQIKSAADPALGGSRTQPLSAIDRDYEIDAGRTVGEIAERGVVSSTIRGLKRAVLDDNANVQRAKEEAAGVAGEMLTRTGDDARRAVLDLEALGERDRIRALTGRSGTASVAGLAGFGIGAGIGSQAGAQTTRTREDPLLERIRARRAAASGGR